MVTSIRLISSSHSRRVATLMHPAHWTAEWLPPSNGFSNSKNHQRYGRNSPHSTRPCARYLSQRSLLTQSLTSAFLNSVIRPTWPPLRQGFRDIRPSLHPKSTILNRTPRDHSLPAPPTISSNSRQTRAQQFLRMRLLFLRCLSRAFSACISSKSFAFSGPWQLKFLTRNLNSHHPFPQHTT